MPKTIKKSNRENETGWDRFLNDAPISFLRLFRSHYKNAFRFLCLILFVVFLGIAIYHLYSIIKIWVDDDNVLSVVETQIAVSNPFPEIVLCTTLQQKISSVHRLVRDAFSAHLVTFTLLGLSGYHDDVVHILSELYGHSNGGGLNDLELIETFKYLPAIISGLNQSFHDLNRFPSAEIESAFNYSDHNLASNYSAWVQKLTKFENVGGWMMKLYSNDSDIRQDLLHKNVHTTDCHNTLSCILLYTHNVLDYINKLDMHTLSLKTGQTSEDFILSCKWKRTEDCRIKRVVTNDGFCYKLLPPPHDTNVSHTGPNSGMSILLDSQAYESFNSQQATTIKVYFKSSEDASDFNRHSFFVNPGQVTDLSINSYFTMFRYRDRCGLEDDAENAEYDQNMCLRMAAHNLTTTECKCKALGHPEVNLLAQDNDAADECISTAQNCARYGSDACMSNGIVPVTKTLSHSGLQCLVWSDVAKLPNFDPQFAKIGDHNHCHNPNISLSPWCFVDTCRDSNETGCIDEYGNLLSKIEKQDCWRECASGPCVQDDGQGGLCANWESTACTLFEGYQGFRSRATNGKECLKWNDRFSLMHYQWLGDHNYCRNPGVFNFPACHVEVGEYPEPCFPACQHTANATPVSIEDTGSALESNLEEDTGSELESNLNCIDEKTHGYQCVANKKSCRPNSYNGYKDTTINGDKCVHWNETTKPKVGDHNLCRNVDGKDSPWCFTSIDSWHYCFADCPAHKNLCLDLTMNCINPLESSECIGESAHVGHPNKTTTRWGHQCLQWDQLSHFQQDYIIDFDAPSDNSCRVGPIVSEVGRWSDNGFVYSDAEPWCVYLDETGRELWETCYHQCEQCIHIRDHHICADHSSVACRHPQQTFLDKRTSLSNKTCLIWNKVGDFQISDENHCRNPNSRDGPWCYIDEDENWEYCFKDCSAQAQCVDVERDCINPEGDVCTAPDAYTGLKNITTTGKTCLNWDLNGYSHVGQHNYCRNPGGDFGPWCFVEDLNGPSGTGFEYCFYTCASNDDALRSRCISDTGCVVSAAIRECTSLILSQKKTTTKHGRKCLDWNLPYPSNSRAITIPVQYARTQQSNLCGNPYMQFDLPWCYTGDYYHPQEYCYELCPNQPEEVPVTSSLSIALHPITVEQVDHISAVQNAVPNCNIYQEFNCANSIRNSNVFDDNAECPLNCVENSYEIDRHNEPLIGSDYHQYLPPFWKEIKIARMDRYTPASRELSISNFPTRKQIRELQQDMLEVVRRIKEIRIVNHWQEDYLCERWHPLLKNLSSMALNVNWEEYIYVGEYVSSMRNYISSAITSPLGLFEEPEAHQSIDKLGEIVLNLKLHSKVCGDCPVADILRISVEYIEQMIKCGSTNVYCIINMYQEFLGPHGPLRYIAELNHFFENFDLLKQVQSELVWAWTDLLRAVHSVGEPPYVSMGKQLLNSSFHTEADFVHIYYATESLDDLRQTWSSIQIAYERMDNVSNDLAAKLVQFGIMKDTIFKHMPSLWPFNEWEHPTPWFGDADLYNVTACFRRQRPFSDPPAFVKSNWFAKFETVLQKTQSFTTGTEYDKNNVLGLNVNFGQLERKIHVQRQAYTVFDMLANIGGILGLYLGATVVTAFELMAYLFEVKGYIVKDGHSKSKIRPRCLYDHENRVSPAESQFQSYAIEDEHMCEIPL